MEGDGYYQPSSNGGQMITFVDGTCGLFALIDGKVIDSSIFHGI